LVRQALGWSDSAANQEASPNGALKEVASTSWGPALLWALAVGLFLYAAWRVVSAFLPGRGGAESWARRIGYLCSAVLYGFLGVTAVALARSEQTATDGNEKVRDAAQRFMENSAGRWLVGIVGVIVVGVGLYRIKKAMTQDVEDELDLGGVPAAQQRWIRRLAVVGEIGRGVALGLVGFFLARAAIDFDPSEATGLDGALRRVVDEGWGQAVVAVVGLGFIAYGIFCAVTFPRRRLEAP
jgi:hypothetical protein